MEQEKKVSAFKVPSANDNKKHALHDDAETLSTLLSGYFQFRRIFTSVVDDVTERSAQNIHWFLKFERVFRDAHAECQRENLKSV